MTVSILVFGAGEVQELLSRIPDSSFRAAKRAFTKNLAEAHESLVTSISGLRLNARSGTLKRSMKFEVSGGNLSSLKASLYSASGVRGKELNYALIQELGGGIKAKNAYKWVPGGPYLNIPMGSNFFGGGILTNAGVPRYTPSQAWNLPVYQDQGQAANGERGRNARAARGRRGEPVRAEFGFLGRTIKTRLKVVPGLGFTVFNERFGPMYRLVKKVNIPPRLEMRKTGEAQTPHLVDDLSALLPLFWRLYGR